jgi:hypothetical protein
VAQNPLVRLRRWLGWRRKQRQLRKNDPYLYK